MTHGLEGIVAAETVLSHTDASRGMIWVRGYDIPSLVAKHGFEGTVALLWDGFAGENLTRDSILASFGQARLTAFDTISDWLPTAAGRPLFEGIRLALAAQPDSADAAGLVGAISVIVPALIRVRAGNPVLPPDPTLTTAADMLRMLHGVSSKPVQVEALDIYWTVMAESGLSASSFAARIVASTQASLAASALAAWCTFTGPLHGGAPGPTLDLVDAAEAADDL